MSDLWAGLPAWGQDLSILAMLLGPVGVIAALVMRGLDPWPLAWGMIRRFGWINGVFTALIAISVGMGIGLIAQERGLRNGTAQAASKFDIVVAAPGSEITILLAAVYLRPADVPLIDGDTFARIATDPRVRLAAPIAFGDSFGGDPVVGTIAAFVSHLGDGAIEGRLFARPHEAVVGAQVEVPLGAGIAPSHGRGSFVGRGVHDGLRYTVVGRLPPTGTPWDRAVLVPVESVWSAHGLAPAGDGPGDALGPPFDPDRFAGTPAVIVVPRTPSDAYGLVSTFTRDARTMAVLPGAVLGQLYAILGDIRQAMSLMSLVAQGLVAASVLTGLVMLLRLFERHMALLRALGAPTRFLIALVWSYAVSLLALGSACGVGIGWAVAAGLSHILTARTGVATPVALGWAEVHLVAGFFSAMACAALLCVWAMIRVPRSGAVWPGRAPRRRDAAHPTPRS